MPFYFAKSDQVIWQSQYYCSATIRMNYNLHWIFVTRGFAANHLDLVTGRAVKDLIKHLNSHIVFNDLKCLPSCSEIAYLVIAIIKVVIKRISKNIQAVKTIISE